MTETAAHAAEVLVLDGLAIAIAVLLWCATRWERAHAGLTSLTRRMAVWKRLPAVPRVRVSESSIVAAALAITVVGYAGLLLLMWEQPSRVTPHSVAQPPLAPAVRSTGAVTVAHPAVKPSRAAAPAVLDATRPALARPVAQKIAPTPAVRAGAVERPLKGLDETRTIEPHRVEEAPLRDVRPAGLAPADAFKPPAPAPAPTAAALKTALSPVPPPPAAAAAAAVTAAARPPDRAAVDEVLAAYRKSYNELDAASVSAIWDGVDRRALQRAFSSLSEQHVSFDRCEVDLTAAQRAVARCDGTLKYVPKFGSTEPRERRVEWTINLRRTDDRWLIAQVAAR